jgi:hypothetical protein
VLSDLHLPKENNFHMKYIKIFESFEVLLPERVNKALDEFGLTMDDIEELFLEFSDMGYIVKIQPQRLWRRNLPLPDLIDKRKNFYLLMVDVMGIAEISQEPEINTLIKNVIKKSKKLGLYLEDPPSRSLEDLRFIFKKR